MKILVIANIANHWQQIIDWIEKLGHTMEITSSCTNGLNKVEQDPDIDCVIADAHTADECGIKFVRNIKKNARLCSIPIIIAGSNFNEETIRQYSELGVDDLMLMPISQATVEAKLARANQFGKKTILIVDDQPVIVEVLELFMKLERYRTVSAGNGREALDIIQKIHVDAIISDIVMPVMSGIDLLIEVKSNFSNIPVILITGLAGNYSPKELIALGADGYFVKPFNNIDLRYTLKQVLSRYTGISKQPRMNSANAMT
jgi:CheY-like chemotaxis protein